MRLLLVAFLLLSPVAFADFNGSWMGTGILVVDYYDDGGTKYTCDEVQVDIVQSATTLQFTTISYDCNDGNGESIGLNYDQIDFEISGTDLLYEGEKTGTITDSKIALLYDDGETDYRTAQTFEMKDGMLTFTDQDEYGGYTHWDLNSTLTPAPQTRTAFRGLQGR